MLRSLPLLALPFLIAASPIQQRNLSSVLAQGEVITDTLVESSDLALPTFGQAATATSVFPDSTATASFPGSGSNFSSETIEPSIYTIFPVPTASFECPASAVATGSSSPASHTGVDGTVTISLPQPTETSIVLEPVVTSTIILGKRQFTSVLASGVLATATVYAAEFDFGNITSTDYSSVESSLPTATVYFTTAALASSTPLPGCYLPSNWSSSNVSSSYISNPNISSSYTSPLNSNISSTLIPSSAAGNATAVGQLGAKPSHEVSGASSTFGTKSVIG
ncbi:hypothetical protein RQP46_008811 [Phenoliferia psychrophenolica]